MRRAYGERAADQHAIMGPTASCAAKASELDICGAEGRAIQDDTAVARAGGAVETAARSCEKRRFASYRGAGVDIDPNFRTGEAEAARAEDHLIGVTATQSSAIEIETVVSARAWTAKDIGS